MLSRRSGQVNNRRRRTHRLQQVHPLSPVLRASHHPVLQDNRVRRCNLVLKPRVLLVNHLPVCRRGRRECRRPAPLARLREDQLFRELPLRPH